MSDITTTVDGQAIRVADLLAFVRYVESAPRRIEDTDTDEEYDAQMATILWHLQYIARALLNGTQRRVDWDTSSVETLLQQFYSEETIE